MIIEHTGDWVGDCRIRQTRLPRP